MPFPWNGGRAIGEVDASVGWGLRRYAAVDFVECYLKPAFVAWRANVPDDLASLDAIEVNPLARQLGVDWKTARKWLKRYFETLKSREGA